MGAGAVARAAPTPAAAVAASRNWPSPPILNRPALKPIPTASPPRTSGVAWRIVFRIGRLRTERTLEQGAIGDERQGPIDRAGRDEARRQDDHAGDDEGQEDGRHGHGRDGEDLTEASAPPEGFGWLGARRRSRFGPARVTDLGRRSPSAGRPLPCSHPDRRSVATSSPRYMTAIRSDSSRTSSSSAETSRIAAPASRISIDSAVDELDAPDVQAARRLVQHQELGLAAELAGDDRLLLVPARQRLDDDRRRRCPDVVPLDELLRPIVDRGLLAYRAAGERRPVVAGQDEVVLQRGAHRSSPSGDGRPGRGRAPPRRAAEAPSPSRRCRASRRCPPVGLAQAGDRLDELVLAVAGDAGDAERLACPNLEVDAADDLAPAVVLGSEAGHRQDDAGRVRLAAIDRRAGRSGRPSAQPGPPRSSRLGPAGRRPCRAG